MNKKAMRMELNKETLRKLEVGSRVELEMAAGGRPTLFKTCTCFDSGCATCDTCN